VGFRPTVWRIARACGLRGDVRNDGEGVLVRAWGRGEQLDRFCAELHAQCPPLARIDALERAPLAGVPCDDFRIVASAEGAVRTGIVPDAATCPACLAELLDPQDRRYRYPFINCTHCGPRLSIVQGIPYDRANTSMAPFVMCSECRAEYEDPANRRFHAQPNACPVCGPRVWLEDPWGNRLEPAGLGAEDAVAAAGLLLARGLIVAVKGIGGFHLACDAGNPAAVAELRRRKSRYVKPFALMARDTGVVRRYCRISEDEAALLAGPEAPILLLEAAATLRVAPEVAPNQDTLGFMLPYSPLHHLLLAGWERPLVMTSGNRSEEPQCIDNGEAVERLAGLADAFLLHDRDIVNRVDDSVMRIMDGEPKALRVARGYAPASVSMPGGFVDAPPVLALGGELKSTICLLAERRAVVSQHLGDQEDARTAREYERTIALYLKLFRNQPEVLAVDLHPGYRSSLLGSGWATREGLTLTEVQHHHAHIAAVLAEHGWPLDRGPVLGIALDGLGYGQDGTLWGGELLVADYAEYRRVGRLAHTPMPGGVKAILEPWRGTYAHLCTHLGWDVVGERYGGLEILGWLGRRPLPVLERMMASGLNTPVTSSAGRLFDAVAAALGLCRETIAYEGQAAVELEVLARRAWPVEDGYPLPIKTVEGVEVMDPAPLWLALLGDLAEGADPSLIAARFHRGFSDALAEVSARLCLDFGLGTVALSGGVFQNRTLLEALSGDLRERGLTVLGHRRVPTNDGGISLGQAAVAAARALLSGP